jgi:hypothetical protein
MKISYLAVPIVIIMFSVVLSRDVSSRSNELRRNQDIAVSSTQISFDQVNPQNTRFGRLTWRGGLILSSEQAEFGGYSGIALQNAGKRLFAVSDKGTWLRADLKYENGMLSGIGKTRIGPLRKKSGKRLRKKWHSDAEDLVLWKKRGVTYALISFERKHRIGRFPITKAGIQKPTNYLKLPKGVFKTTQNKGLEALTILTDKKNIGTVLTFLERHHDKNGNHKGWLIRGKKSWPIRLKRRDEFDVTSLTTLANGNVLVLERFFSLFSGVQMRIREIKFKDIKRKAVLDGEILLSANMRYNIDNMEGISNHTNKKGETIITLMSDDNFNESGLQKTILIQFKLD